ncbi:MAG: glycosyltransferase family 2 protein, partial [Chloroflexi bacterium]|nr:glycosyltransferase family 2 protein [Chloroflexota bacterium]
AVVIPAYRVERTIGAVVNALPSYVRHVIVVNDASPDQTARVLELAAQSDSRIEVIAHDRNRGVGGALVSGIRRALELGAQIVIKIDGDGQAPLERLPELLAPLARGQADMTKGNRFRDFEALRQMPLIRRMGNMVLSFLVKAATGYWTIFDPTNGFIAVRGELLAKLPLDQLDPSYFFEISFLGHLYEQGAVVRDVETPARYGDETSSLSIAKVLIEFPPRLLLMLLRRIVLKYAIHDFSMGSVHLIVGVPLLLFGLVFGMAKWIHYSHLGLPAPTGTVMLATLPVILGVQLLLSAAAVDLQAVPSEPVSPPLSRDP